MRVNPAPRLPIEFGSNGYRLAVQDFATEHARSIAKAEEQSLIVACSDETTALTTGTAKVTFRFPWTFLLYKLRISLSTAQTSGNIFTVDVNVSGSTILSTKLTVDNTEKTSYTAATQAVLTITLLRIIEDAEVTIDIDQVGDGTAKGLKVTFIGVRE